MWKNLTVFLLYHPSSEVRGKMRRYFYEVKANTFVGTVSASVRDTLWQNIVESKTELYIIAIRSNDIRYRDSKFCVMDKDKYIIEIK